MKKILLALAFIISVAFVSNAQVTVQNSVRTALSSLDTLIDADTTTTVIVTPPGNKAALSFQAVVTKISGTVAGTVTLYGSLDGTNYAVLNTDTLTNTTGTKVYQFSYAYSPDYKYRFEVITSGTVSASVRRWVLYR